MKDNNDRNECLSELESKASTINEELLRIEYNELRRLAAHYMRCAKDGTLQPTALVHEVYLKLIKQKTAWKGSAHFVGVAAQLMRRILINHARHNNAVKRGGPAEALTLDDGIIFSSTKAPALVALDDALKNLEVRDARQCEIVELHFFGGFTFEEIAEVLSISVRTAKRDWEIARRWLHREMQ